MNKISKIDLVTIIIALCNIVLLGVRLGIGFTSKPDTTVAIEDTFVDAGRLTIYVDPEGSKKGEANGFIHEDGVVDYVPGESTVYYLNASSEVISKGALATYVVIKDGEVLNKAVLKNGEIVVLDTHLGILPRSAESFIVNGSASDKRQLILSLGLDGTYALTVSREGLAPKFATGVIDAWTTDDVVYWCLGNGTVYSFEWTNPSASPETFFEGALAVSHRSDEAQGAIVLPYNANYSAHGRDDIFSPYGLK